MILSSHGHAPTHAPMREPSQISILIACEESQSITKAFRYRGYNAYSCDIKPCSGRHPEWHILGDCIPYLNGETNFTTETGERCTVDRWTLIIAHPPCTYLCKVSSVHMIKDGRVNEARFKLMIEAREFFYRCLNASADFVAVENPLPMARAGLPRPSFYLQPFWFGVKYSKKTLFWVRNLPPIMPTIINPDFKCFVTSSRSFYRARTFPQVAAAIADQWGKYILENIV